MSPIAVRPSPVVRSLAFAALVAVPLAAQPPAATVPARAATPLAPQVAPAGRYDFVLEESDGERNAGTVSWRGDMVRIDTDRPLTVGIDAGDGQRRAARDAMRDTERRPGRARKDRRWYLVDRRAGLLHSVRDDEREIETFRAPDFEALVTRVLSMIGPMVAITATDAGIVARALGDGGTIAGTPVKHFRIVERYVQRVRAVGIEASVSDVTVTTDYRVPVRDGVPANPVAALALDGANEGTLFDAGHRARVAQARAQLFTGAPLAVEVVREARDRDDGSTERESARFMVTARGADTGDASRFALPAGYARRDAKLPGR